MALIPKYFATNTELCLDLFTGIDGEGNVTAIEL